MPDEIHRPRIFRLSKPEHRLLSHIRIAIGLSRLNQPGYALFLRQPAPCSAKAQTRLPSAPSRSDRSPSPHPDAPIYLDGRPSNTAHRPRSRPSAPDRTPPRPLHTARDRAGNLHGRSSHPPPPLARASRVQNPIHLPACPVAFPRTPVKLVDLSPCAQEGFLHQVFRIRFAVRHTIAKPEHSTAMPLH